MKCSAALRGASPVLARGGLAHLFADEGLFIAAPGMKRGDDDREQHGRIPPSVGMYPFVIQAQAPEVRITSIYRGIIPFLVAPLILIVLMFLFPGLALWLPKALYG